MELITMQGADKIARLAKDLGLIETLKQKLMKQPDAAADHLAAVLEELQKSLVAFEHEVTNYLAIALDPGPDLRADLTVLYSLEGDALRMRVQAAHTRCAKVGAIYRRYLDPWFQRVSGLNSTERGQLRNLFENLSHIDNELIDMLSPATTWLADVARQTLDAYESGNVELAKKTITTARREILPTRRALVDALDRMRSLERDFIEVAAIA
jgi:hypothetical protein